MAWKTQIEAWTAFLLELDTHVSVDRPTLIRVGMGLLTYANRHQNYQVRKGWSSFDESATAEYLDALYRREGAVERKLLRLAAEVGCTIRFSGNPRRESCRLILADGYNNARTGTGMAIPTAR